MSHDDVRMPRERDTLSTADSTAPPSAAAPNWSVAGASFARMALSWREWVHRRVEVISFVDQTIARRTVSIDFTLPDVTPPMRSSEQDLLVVPLTRLRKRTLTNFDLVDEGGRAVPMFTRPQRKRLATEALFMTVYEEMGDAAPLDDIKALCEAIATSSPGKADQSLEHLYEIGVDRNGVAGSLARTLAVCFFVTVVLPAHAGARRALTFSYDEVVGDPDPGRLTEFARGAAWRAKPVWFPIEGMSDVSSYHLEVQAPTGLWIVRRELFVSDQRTNLRGGPSTRARFYNEPTQNSHGLAAIHLRPQTSTVLRAAASVSWMACLLLFSIFFVLWWGGFQDNDTNAPALLLFLPAAVSVLLVRAGEHAMTTDMLWFVRLLTLTPSALAFIGGAIFAALPHASSALPYVFGALALLAYVPTAVLTMGWRLCMYPKDPDQVKTRAAHTY